MSANQPAKLTMLVLLSWLLISYGISSVRCSTVHDNITDMLSLLDFKRAIVNNPRQALSSWHTGIPHCRWESVNCSLTHPGRVTVLNLGALGLSGPISPSIGNLTFLRSLNISYNGFIGELPPLKRLGKLQDLELPFNYLQGIIRDALTNCSNLEVLDLSGNFLIGEIPSNIGLLSNLFYLGLSINNLTGMIPPSLRNISQLQFIWLADNHLTGTIPDEIGKLSYLMYLFIGGNSLTGRIPESSYKYKQSSLLALDMSFNHLTGQVPSSLGNLGLLEYINIQGNKLNGQIPSSIEYAQTGQASTCGDVYSFGTVLLEMLTGRRPTDPTHHDELNIVDFVENFLDRMFDIIDDHLQEELKELVGATREQGKLKTWYFSA